MATILAGTFSFLHKGHRKLLDAAIATGDTIIVGITTDEFAASRKNYNAPSYKDRAAAVSGYLKGKCTSFSIRELSSEKGNAASDPGYTNIVVSHETYRNAVSINMERVANGLKPLRIIRVPVVRADDLVAVKSSRIASGTIDAEGRRLTRVAAVISTNNNLKASTAQSYLSSIIKDCEVRINRDYRTENDQPFGEETMKMAISRAEQSAGRADFSIGIESGLFYDPNSGGYFDFHCCCIIDSLGERTFGMSSGFNIPDRVVDEIKTGMDMSSAFAKLYGIEGIGEREGIVGYLTRNNLKRETLIFESLRNAMVTRFSDPGPD